MGTHKLTTFYKEVKSAFIEGVSIIMYDCNDLDNAYGNW